MDIFVVLALYTCLLLLLLLALLLLLLLLLISLFKIIRDRSLSVGRGGGRRILLVAEGTAIDLKRR